MKSFWQFFESAQGHCSTVLPESFLLFEVFEDDFAVKFEIFKVFSEHIFEFEQFENIFLGFLILYDFREINEIFDILEIDF